VPAERLKSMLGLRHVEIVKDKGVSMSDANLAG
jgi:hypothetical protein